MAGIGDIFNPRLPQSDAASQAMSVIGVVTEVPESANANLRVTTDNFAHDHYAQWVPRFASNSGIVMPAVGDQCLVTFDNFHNAWVIAYWTDDNEDAVAPVGDDEEAEADPDVVMHDDLQYLLAEKSDEGHNHDERYWKQSADLVDRDDLAYLLAEKSDEGHNHDEDIATALLDYDDRDTLDYKLAEKSDEGHNHDGRYWPTSTDLATQIELDAEAAARAAADALLVSISSLGTTLQDYDDRDTIDYKLAEKSDEGHRHQDLSDALESADGWINQLIDYQLAEKSDEGHNHDDRYLSVDPLKLYAQAASAGNVTLQLLDYLLAEKADEGHNHDSRYLSKIKMGTYTTATTTGSQAITGVGFKPKLLITFGALGDNANAAFGGIGATDGTTQVAFSWAGTGSTNLAQNNLETDAFFLHILTTGVVSKEFAFTSFDIDGFTFNRVTNDAQGFVMAWIAIG